MLKWFFFVPVGLVSAIEVWLLLYMGQAIGLFWTLLWMVGSFCLGVFLLRWEGLVILTRIHRQLLNEVIPTDELLGMVMLGLGSLLLILPGFFTDFVGLAVILPPSRWIFRWLVMAWIRRAFEGRSSQGQPGNVHAQVEPVIDITPNE